MHPIRIHRLAKELLQTELAQSLGTSNLMVGLWEKGRGMPSRKYLGKLADAFGLSKVQLLQEISEWQEKHPEVHCSSNRKDMLSKQS
jgi:putative transcriptional regulator